jgi:CRP/FNR family transcriptional regulator, cyclic AMP receptor protein
MTTGLEDVASEAAVTLRRFKLFRGLSSADCDTVIDTMRYRSVRSGEKLFLQGETGDTMLVVIDGILRVEVTDLDGNNATVGKVEAGEIVGEMAVVDPAPRSTSVVAATDCTLYELSRADLMALRRLAPSASAAIVGGVINDITRRLRNVNKRIDGELNPTAMKISLTGSPQDESTGRFFGRIWDRMKGQ